MCGQVKVVLKTENEEDMLILQHTLVVAIESTGRQVPIAFLERVKEDFNKKYGGGKVATAKANSLNREFGQGGERQEDRHDKRI